jgi:hypothetical protein
VKAGRRLYHRPHVQPPLRPPHHPACQPSCDASHNAAVLVADAGDGAHAAAEGAAKVDLQATRLARRVESAAESKCWLRRRQATDAPPPAPKRKAGHLQRLAGSQDISPSSVVTTATRRLASQSQSSERSNDSHAHDRQFVNFIDAPRADTEVTECGGTSLPAARLEDDTVERA